MRTPGVSEMPSAGIISNISPGVTDIDTLLISHVTPGVPVDGTSVTELYYI